MTRSGESEQRIAEALRARATGAGRAGPGVPMRWSAEATGTPSAKLALLAALGVGVLIGVLLALLSLIAPGVLPPLG